MLVFKLERVKNIFENEKPKLKFYEIKKRTKVQKLILTYGKVSILKKSRSTIVIYEALSSFMCLVWMAKMLNQMNLILVRIPLGMTKAK